MVRIMSDSASMFTKKTASEIGVDIVPFIVTINGKSYREIEEISSVEFLEEIAKGGVPVSSQPNPGEVMEIFETATKEHPVLYIAMADGLSGAYSSACGVRETMHNKEYITVLNSRCLCGPQGALVRKAAKLAEKGHGVEEIVALLEENMASNKSFLIPQDFDYLRRGGRLSPGVSMVGSLLKLTAMVVQAPDGRSLDKVGLGAYRNFTKAVEKAIEGFKRWGVDERYLISISHADTIEQARLAYNMISAEFHGAALEICDLPPVFITHGGPACVSIQAILRN